MVKLEIGKQHSQLVGMRVYLSNGAAAGELNKNDYGDGHETEILGMSLLPVIYRKGVTSIFLYIIQI